MIERLRSPRKSILSRPSDSTPYISYWVTTSAPSPFCWMGTTLMSGSGAITTAAAWIESCRRNPSRPRAASTVSRTAGSAS